jgi:PAS domain S-box-containing protein
MSRMENDESMNVTVTSDINHLTKAQLQSELNEYMKGLQISANIFKAMPTPATLMTPDGKRIDANEACIEYFKRSEEEYISVKLEKLYAKEDTPKIKKALEDCKRTGFSSCEVEVIKGDGTKAPAILNLSTVKDEEGNLVNIIETAQDITELRKREEELEASKIYFQNFFNSSPVPLTLIGLGGKRLDCNPAMEELTGRSKEGLVNVPVESAYLKEEQPSVRKKLVDKTIEKGYIHGFETYFLRPDGTKLAIVANTALIRDRKDKPSSVIYSAMDISELKRREEELEQAVKIFREVLAKAAEGDLSARVDFNELSEGYRVIGEDTNKMLEEARKREGELKVKNKELEDFAYIVSHDLKSPLVTINGVANILQRISKRIM